MISLFGREEFDPPGSAMKDPRTTLQLSGFWIVLLLSQIGFALDRLSRLRSSGRPISVGRKVEVGFWVAMLLCWLWSGWMSFRKYRAERAEQSRPVSSGA